MWWLIVMVVAAVICWWIIISPYKYWTNRGVEQSSPIFPLGDNWGLYLGYRSFVEMAGVFYKMFPNKRYAGIYQFIFPVLVIRDPDLVKQVLIKDFDHFGNHKSFVSDADADPIWGRNLVCLKDEKWREMRTILSPAFTSNKMKYIFSLMLQTGEQFINHFLKKDDSVIPVEMKDLSSKFTNDVIANTVFGIECDSFSDPNNEFYMMSKHATDFSSVWKVLRFLGFFMVPQIYRMLKIQLFPSYVYDFFIEIVKSNIETREKHGIVRPDLINLFMEARTKGLKNEETLNEQETGLAKVQESESGKKQKGVKKQTTDLDVSAQALIFFFAGFDTVASLMCLMSYELGINPEVQEKLTREIDETVETCNGKLTYEALVGMKYMDMVVSESLRKYPSTGLTDRLVTKPYTIAPKYPDEKPVHLTRGDAILVPIFGIHRDPEYFPDPERFDPERFSDENKHNIKPYTYIPFGLGPRNCIGSRFTILEVKTLFFFLLSHFEIIPVKETQIPLKMKKRSFNLSAEGGIHFGLKRRFT